CPDFPTLRAEIRLARWDFRTHRVSSRLYRSDLPSCLLSTVLRPADCRCRLPSDSSAEESSETLPPKLSHCNCTGIVANLATFVSGPPMLCCQSGYISWHWLR